MFANNGMVGGGMMVPGMQNQFQNGMQNSQMGIQNGQMGMQNGFQGQNSFQNSHNPAFQSQTGLNNQFQSSLSLNQSQMSLNQPNIQSQYNSAPGFIQHQPQPLQQLPTLQQSQGVPL